ncbi:MAG: hypothetical protein WCA97_11350 [Terriglobales bacterium]
MEAIMRDFARVFLVVSIVVGCGLAQDTTKEKHVRDIKAEQTQEAIFASPLCQRVKVDGRNYYSRPQVNPATLAADLYALMQQSDEVVVTSGPVDLATAISPSGEDVGEYFDVKVLRSWKGTHKVGDLLTFGVPQGTVNCEPTTTVRSGPFVGASTLRMDWLGQGSLGPYVLFLRQSRSDEKELIPGLRLTGGDGLQGFFSVLHNKNGTECTGGPSRFEKCLAVLDTIQEPISVQYRPDPLKKKYDGMPTSKFIKEVQSVADSLGYSGQANSAK